MFSFPPLVFLGGPEGGRGVLLPEQSQMSVLDLCPGLGYKSQKLEA